MRKKLAVIAATRSLPQEERARVETQWLNEKEALVTRAEQLEENALKQAEKLSTSRKSVITLSDEIQVANLEIQRLSQQVKDYETFVSEKDRVINSLEEKHNHSRRSLDHYRQSVKDQRDQDFRRHETQVQQLQSEIREASQIIAVKQEEVTKTSKETVRLETTLKANLESIDSLKSEFDTVMDRSQKLERENANLVSKLDSTELSSGAKDAKLRNAEKKILDFGEVQSSLIAANDKLEAELKIKSDLIERFMTDGSQGEITR